MADKKEILWHIRQIAAANGGVPPGRRRLTSETGIRDYDWEGFYWVRWSDALQEAGFEPNTMCQPHADEFLMESLISVLRERGHFPTRHELRYRAVRDPNFPGAEAFSRRWKKPALIAKVIEFCRGRTGYDDVLAICGPLIKPAKTAPPQEVIQPSAATDSRHGYVYLFKCQRRYKIGRTNSVQRRRREIGGQLPEKVHVIHTIKTDDPVGVEDYWHKRFAAKRVQGEWFALDRADVMAFKQCLFS